MKLGLRRHANTHDPEKGSDPLSFLLDYLRFNYDNQGQDDGSLAITARGEAGASDAAISLTALAENGGAGDIDLTAEGNINATATAGISLAEVGGNTFQISPAGFLVLLTAGDTFVISDHLGSPLVTYTG